MYEIIYDVDDEVRNVSEIFRGSWFDLQDRIHDLRVCDCYNIAINYIGSEEEDDTCDDW